MAFHRVRLLTKIVTILLISTVDGALGGALARAEGGLKTIDPPGGGKIVYGQVQGQTTEAGAMGAILRNLHSQLGDRPQVGKLFQVHGSESVATFFTVTKKTQDGRKIGGMIIAIKASSDSVEAALLTDDADRFSKTVGPMTKTLFSVWHPLQGGEAEVSGAGSGGSAAALRQVTLNDNSASVGLPAGWQIVSKLSGGGSAVASGPNGESAEMGITFLAQDTNNPTVQRTMQTLRNGGLRNTIYAQASYLPYGSDMSKTFVYFIQKVRKQAGLQEATYNFSSVTPETSQGQQRCVRMKGTVDFNDQKGPKTLNAIFCTNPPDRFGGWSAVVNMTSVPVEFAPKEQSTLAAILNSFNPNQAVIARQAQQYAQPEIDRIHAIGRASVEAARQAHIQEDIHNSSVYKQWDTNDKRSQEFENYQLGNAVISTTDNGAHGTFTQEEAAYLVQEHPDKFEFVSAPNYWKGIDY